METSVSDAVHSDPAFSVFDLHTHPTLKTFMFGKRFWERHRTPGFFFPLTLRVHLDALREGGVSAFSCSTYAVERGWLEYVWLNRLSTFLWPNVERMFTEAPDDLARELLNHCEQMVRDTVRRRGPLIEVAHSFEEYEDITRSGKIALLHSLEGAHHLNHNLDNLEDFYNRGVCLMTVAHIFPNEASECVDAIPPEIFLRKLGCFNYKFDPEGGLSEFGYQLIERMLEIGMIVDMTHMTPRGRAQTLEIARNSTTKRPVILSHVGVFEYCRHPMNPTAEEIRRIADTGGVIGIIMMDRWLADNPPRLCADVILRTVEHLVKHGGEDVVAIGSDFDGFTYVPRDFASPRDYRRLRTLLLEHYSPEQVSKFLNGNARRVLYEGWGKRGKQAVPKAATG